MIFSHFLVERKPPNGSRYPPLGEPAGLTDDALDLDLPFLAVHTSGRVHALLGAITTSQDAENKRDTNNSGNHWDNIPFDDI